MRQVLLVIALLVCVRVTAQDVGVADIRVQQTPQRWQQLVSPDMMTILPIAMPTFDIAEEVAAVSAPPVPAPADLYAEAQVVELITQIACEELRYPQRSPAGSEKRYRELANAMGFVSGGPAKLQRTLRYYQSNDEFLRVYQQPIAENALRCAMEQQQASVVP